jgi:hypothetical protein
MYEKFNQIFGYLEKISLVVIIVLLWTALLAIIFALLAKTGIEIADLITAYATAIIAAVTIGLAATAKRSADKAAESAKLSGTASEAAMKAAEAQLLLQFMAEYRQDELQESLKRLDNWEEWRHEAGITWKDVTESALVKWAEETGQHDRDRVKRDAQRVMLYYFAALNLSDLKLVSDGFLEKAFEPERTHLLFEVVERLERLFAPDDYEQLTVRKFNRLYDLIRKFKRLNIVRS